MVNLHDGLLGGHELKYSTDNRYAPADMPDSQSLVLLLEYFLIVNLEHVGWLFPPSSVPANNDPLVTRQV